MTTMGDDELEARVRETLRAVAAATPVDDDAAALPSYDEVGRGRRPGWVAAAAAAVLLVLAGVGVAVRAGDDGDGGVTVASPPPSSAPPTTHAPTPEPAPGAHSDGVVFTADGDARTVADAYLRERGVSSPTLVQELDGRAAASWNVNDDSGVVAEGTVYLGRVGEGWAVVEAITDGVTVDDLRVERGRLTATVTTTNQNSLVLEVLDTDGNAFRGGDRIGPAHPSIDVDVTIGEQPVILRAQLIGGAMLSVTEILVNPLVPEDGSVVADGLWEGGGWRILEQGDCAWIELNGIAQGPTCGIDGADTVLQFGAIAQFSEETLYFGIVGPDVASVRMNIADGQTISTDTVAGDGASRYVALSVPSLERATVEFVAADGSVLGQNEVDPGGTIG